MIMAEVLEDPFSYMQKGKIDKAIKLFTKAIENKPSSIPYAGRAGAYLIIGKLDESLADLKKAEEFRNREIPDRVDAYLQQIGMILWLKGQEKEAAEHWFNLVKEMDAGKIVFSDMAGGVINGALLWFASCFNEELKEYKEKAEKYLKKKAKTSRVKYWPGPIAQYLLGYLSEKDLKGAACESTGLLQKRYLCQAHFYTGVKAYYDGDIKNVKTKCPNPLE